MLRFIAFISVLLAAGACGAEPSSKPWEMASHPEKVIVFPVEHIPYATFFFAYAMPGRPDDILVSPADAEGRIHPWDRWIPAGMPLAAYVYVLHLKSGKHDLMPHDAFMSIGAVTERFDSPRPDAYPELNTGGTVVDWGGMVSVRKGTPVFATAISFEAKEKGGITFGLPSILPFMGRQNLIEMDTYYSGTVFLDVFDMNARDASRVRLKKRFKNQSSYPGFTDLACWVQGADRPMLVIVEKSGRRYDSSGRLLVVIP